MKFVPSGAATLQFILAVLFTSSAAIAAAFFVLLGRVPS